MSDPGFRVYQGSLQPKSFPPVPEDWISEWETFPSADGALQLFAALHHPKDWQAKERQSKERQSNEWQGHRALIVLHGLGEHGGRYLHFPHFLKGTVDAVYCLDHRGHGRSEGLRGHVDRFDLFADDAALAVRRLEDHLRKRFGKAEIHLFAHSMGGLVALRTLFLHPNLPLSSVTISAPLLGVKVELPIYKRAAAHALSKVWGSLHMDNEIDPNCVSHDREVVEAYRADRLVHSKGTPRFYTEMLGAIDDTMRRDSGLTHPLQFLVPMQDELVNSEESLRFFRSLKLRDKQLKTYPGFFHESFNEVGKERAFEDLNAWIVLHSGERTLQ